MSSSRLPFRSLANRIFIFSILGPLIGLAVFASPLMLAALITGPASNSSSAGRMSNFEAFALILLGAYTIGVFPGVFAAVADRYFETNQHRRRWVTVVGFLTGFLLACISPRGRIDRTAILVGLCGAVAAYVCSWVHQRVAEPRSRPLRWKE